MSTTIEDLVESIDGRIRELNGEIASLQDALEALGSKGSSAPAPKPRARAARRKPQVNQVVPAGQLVQILADSEGLTTAELAKKPTPTALRCSRYFVIWRRRDWLVAPESVGRPLERDHR